MQPNHVDIKAAHSHSSRNRTVILKSSICGCFYCGKTFPPTLITEWRYFSQTATETAFCPFCEIDSVIGDAGGFPITPAFLKTMTEYWFENED